MACTKGYTSANAAQMLAVMREPGLPRPPRVIPDPGDDHLNLVASLANDQVGAVGEAAAARFLEIHLGLSSPVEHAATAAGLDHVLVTPGQQLVIGETKATRGLSAAAQRAIQADTTEAFANLLSRGQMSEPWKAKGLARDVDGAGLEAVVASLGCRVDLASQTIDLWEQGPDGTWTELGTFVCETADLVSGAFGA